MIGYGDLDWVFGQHEHKDYVNIRQAAKAFAEVVLNSTRACSDQEDAIRHIRLAQAMAEAAITLEGRS